MLRKVALSILSATAYIAACHPCVALGDELTAIYMEQHSFAPPYSDTNPGLMQWLFTPPAYLISNYNPELATFTPYTVRLDASAPNAPYGDPSGVVWFVGPTNAPFVPGQYTGTTYMSGFSAPGESGFALAAGQGNAVSPTNGLFVEFTVLEAKYSSNDAIQHFGATFEVFDTVGPSAPSGAQVPEFDGYAYYNYDVPPSATPEPSSASLVAAALGVAGLLVWRMRAFRFV